MKPRMPFLWFLCLTLATAAATSARADLEFTPFAGRFNPTHSLVADVNTPLAMRPVDRIHNNQIEANPNVVSIRDADRTQHDFVVALGVVILFAALFNERGAAARARTAASS